MLDSAPMRETSRDSFFEEHGCARLLIGSRVSIRYKRTLSTNICVSPSGRYVQACIYTCIWIAGWLECRRDSA